MTLPRALCILLPFLLPVSAIAQTDASALQWLQRIYSATQKLSYSGTFVYQHGQQVETSTITHLVDGSGGPHERIETLDGVPREIIRNRDEVVCYLPASMTVKIDKQPGWRSFPAILPEQLKDLSQSYRIRKAETERVAGYDCQVIVLEPKDRMRYGHRLWADLSTGMLLKAKTFDDRMGVIEQFTFTQLRVEGNIDPNRVQSRFARRGRDWNIENSEATQANLANAGWIIKSMPPGFRTVAELTRTLGGISGVSHIVVSDGLAAMSVFIEPAASKQRTPQPGLVRQGVINVYMRLVGGYWVTVVGETPPESVKYIADAVEHRK